METNEAWKTTVVQEAETEIMHLLTHLQDVQVGDLKGVEREVLARVCALGRSV